MDFANRRAISYIRFSSKAQATGHSLSRQLERAREYAREHKLILDERSYRDLGISAFRGKNATEGALSTFLAAIDGGLVERDTILLIESFDRLSRNEVDEALRLFLDITGRGVTIVTLIDGQVYSKATIKQNWTQLIVTLALFARAHEESATKSDRVKRALASARAKGKKLSKCPKWLRLSDDKTEYVVIEDEAKIVRRAFDLRADGIGAHKIGHMLTEEFGIKTSTPQVVALLKNPSVIGTRVSQAGYEPILDYYKPIISKTQFYEVQSLLGTTIGTRRGRRPDDEPNLFSGLMRCMKCGGRLRFNRQTKNVSQQYFACLNGLYKRGCDAKHINYDAFEKAMLGWLLMDQDKEIIPLLDKHTPKPQTNFSAEIQTLREQKDRLVDLLALGTLTNTEIVAHKLNELDAKIKAFQAALMVAEAEPSDRLPAERAWSLAVRHEEAALDDDPTEFYAVRREIKVAFQKAIRVIRVAPEVRVDDELHVDVDIEFVGSEAVKSLTYIRPALRHVKGRLVGSRRWKREQDEAAEQR